MKQSLIALVLTNLFLSGLMAGCSLDLSTTTDADTVDGQSVDTDTENTDIDAADSGVDLTDSEEIHSPDGDDNGDGAVIENGDDGDEPEGFGYLAAPLHRMVSVCAGKIPNLSTSEAELFAKTFVLAHGAFGAANIQKLKAANPALKIVKYMNGTYTRGTEDGVAAEKNKKSIAMTRIAVLAEAVTAGATQLKLRGLDGETIALRSSTSPDDESHVDSKQPKLTTYVVWIRIANELMRVSHYNATKKIATVTRAYEGSNATPHAAGANVLSPLYVGQDGQTGGSEGTYAGGNGTRIRYCLDPWSDYGNTIKANEVAERVNAGYDGAWLDTCNVGTFNLCDMFGRKASPWNVRTDTKYEHADFAAGQDHKMDYIQKHVEDKTGLFPTLAANNISKAEFIEGAFLMENLLISTPLKLEPIDGFSMEGFLGEAYEEQFESRLHKLRRAISLDLAVIPQIGNSGSKSRTDSEPDTPKRDRIDRFSYAFWLLAVRPDQEQRKAMFGTYAFYSEPGNLNSRYVDVHRMYFLPLGRPLDKLPPEKYEKYRVPGTETYMREFENGFVLLNSSTSTQVKVELPEPLINPDSNEQVIRYRMAPKSGKILLKKWAPR